MMEQQTDKEAEMVKISEERAKEQYIKKVEKQQGVYTKQMNDAYKELMFINTIFSKEKTLDVLIEDVHPNIKIKQGQKKIIRYLSKVFIQELTQLAVQAKESKGRKQLDKQSVEEAVRKYYLLYPIAKDQGKLFE